MKYTLITLAIAGFLFTSCGKKGSSPESEKARQDSISKVMAEIAKIDEADFAKANGVLTPEILWKFGRLEEMQVSPDGKTILFSVKKYYAKYNKGNQDLYTIPVSGGEPVKVTDFDGSEFNGLWRPDGKKIGFICAESGSPQVWEMNPDGSDKKQVSDIPDGIEGFNWSPDGNNVVYIKAVKIDKSPQDIYPDLPEANVHIAEDLNYRHWNAWHDYTYLHLFVASYKNGKIAEGKDLLEKEQFDCPVKPFGGMEQIAWSPDSKKIAYVCKKNKGKEYALSTNSDIYLYDIATGKTENLSKGMLGYDMDPVFSPDGKMIAWHSMKTPGYESDKDRIIIYDVATGKWADYSENFDQSSTNLSFSADNKQLYFISVTKGTTQVYSMEIASKTIKQVSNGQHDYKSYGLAGDKVIGVKMSMSMPAEIFSINLKDGKETQLTFTNKDILAKIKMGKVEERWMKTVDGKQMLTWIIYPPDFDATKKYPAILFCQGGPQSPVSQNFHYRWNFQAMAANGYIIVAPNRRGCPGFGQEWVDQIAGDYGGLNIQDYLTAIDEMSKEPFVNKDKLGAVGASYGGYSIFWLASHHNNRFKCFISHCGMYNLESQYAETEEFFFVNHDLGGAPWEKTKSYSYSPHLYVKSWNTPIMIISGENDFRIPYSESLQAFNAAQLLGIPSKLLIFPEESHFVVKPQNSILWHREFYDWLGRWLK